VNERLFTGIVQIELQDIAQSPRPIFTYLYADIDMARSQFRCGIVVDVSMEIEKPWGNWGKRNNRAV